MDYKYWKLKKTQLDAHLEEYAAAAAWCNENGYHIEEQGDYYVVVANPPDPELTPQEVIKTQILALEEQITERNVRGAILGDEFALNKLQTTEAQIAELRRQLEAL